MALLQTRRFAGEACAGSSFIAVHIEGGAVPAHARAQRCDMIGGFLGLKRLPRRNKTRASLCAYSKVGRYTPAMMPSTVYPKPHATLRSHVKHGDRPCVSRYPGSPNLPPRSHRDANRRGRYAPLPSRPVNASCLFLAVRHPSVPHNPF